MTNPTPGQNVPPATWNPNTQRWERDGRYFDDRTQAWLPIENYATFHTAPGVAPAPKPSDAKKAILVLGLLAVAVIGALIFAFNSSDDMPTTSNPVPVQYLTGEDRYVQALGDRGLNHQDGEEGMIEFGYLICEALESYPASKIVTEVAPYANSDLDKSDVRFIVEMAGKHLC